MTFAYSKLQNDVGYAVAIRYKAGEGLLLIYLYIRGLLQKSYIASRHRREPKKVEKIDHDLILLL